MIGRVIAFSLATVMLALPAAAQLGWTVPSLDTASMIGQQVVASELGVRAAGGSPGRATRSRSATAAGGALGFAPTGPNDGLFANALAPSARPMVEARTSFTRSLALQRKSEAVILDKVRERQPAAVAEYARFFREQNMATEFERSSKEFGFRSDDAADTMTAYWLMAWAVANKISDIDPGAARAVRDQVKGGIARTAVGSYSPAKMHQLADEAIFNFIVLVQAFQFTQAGKISKADYARLGDATQKSFLALGADLRELRLTDSGFVKR